ncbi:hypothetical protein ACOMHN_022989 [Nucella lapillus]
MEDDLAARFISSLTKSLQAVIHGCLDFDKDIELGGYVYLKVDNAERIDYVLSEKMLKSDLNSMTFHSSSFHALPQSSPAGSKAPRDKTVSASGSESAGKSASSGRVHSASNSESSMYSATLSAGSANMSHQNLPPSHTQNSDSFMHPKNAPSDEFQISSGSMKLQRSSSNKNATATSTEAFRSKNRSLTDFQTAFRNPSASLSSPLHQSSSAHNWSPSHNGSNSRSSAPSHTVQQQQQQQQQQQIKSSILPDPSDMEVVHVKTEEEDDVFNIPLQCHQGGSESDGFAPQEKSSWLAMRMRQPFYFPYPRLARSQSFDQRMNMARSNPRFPFFSGEGNSETTSLTCKVCGKCYRSRQGLLFHERAKHQNVFNVYCPVCGKGFQQTTHMYGHMATHTNIKNFQCQACGAKYAHKTSLQQHLRSGSCRASQVSNPGGLDLSTSQLFRDFPPYNLAETQSRPSPSHSHSQSPVEAADTNSLHGHGGDRDMGLSEGRLATFGQANQLDNDFDGCDKLDSTSHKTAHQGMSTEVGSFDSPEDDQVLDQGISGYGNLSGGMAGTQDCGDIVFPSRGDPRELMNSRGVSEGLNLISREDTRGSATTGSPSPHTLGIDMTKDTQGYNAGSASSACDDSLNKQDALYEHDSDVPETVSLSFSADDD